MSIGILRAIGSILNPVRDIIDNVTTTDEERLSLKLAFETLEHDVQMLSLRSEMSTLQAQASIVRAEAQGVSWLQRTWRPITMLIFVSMTVFDYYGPMFGFNPPTLNPELWMLIKIGLGGYVIGRSGEKIAEKMNPSNIQVSKDEEG